MSTPAQRLLAREADWGRAPSAHNSQPWALRAVGADRLMLGWDPSRSLPLGDPTGRDLLLSLGCVVEALAVVAADLGLGLDVRWEVDRAAHHAATLVVRKRTGDRGGAVARLGAAAALEALRHRRTARGVMAVIPTEAEVADLAESVGVGLQVLPGAWVDEHLLTADRWSLEGPAAEELADWLRLDPTAPRYGQDGLSDVALGLNGLEARVLRAALRPGVRPRLARVGLTGVLARFSTTRPVGPVVAFRGVAAGGTSAEGGPSGCVAAADDADVAEAGRLLLRTWLVADRAGWSVHPLSQLLDCPQTAAAMPEVLPGAGGSLPLAVFRIGRPRRRPPASARLGGAGGPYDRDHGGDPA
ncbi:hypothetical protein SAMN05445756_1075 [Kytococcus aerolatus]|uniref:Nitroreductase family protein n=1 Tax=Kytococcus aerolatus TaxID=592308 RepID=A0A212TDW9_9MICO|nr:hypothetical protein [Kytococcus aerolatus]SNC64258.1 hypothetical protein SAMN05445756_1075 [Kytococcus aerolatus]